MAPRTIFIFLLLCSLGLTGLCPAAVTLSDAERQWLEKNRHRLVLGFNRHYHPIEFLSEEGRFEGIGADVFRLIEQRIGIEIPHRTPLPWSKLLDDLRAGEPVIAPVIVQTPQRSRYALFTKPYLEIPLAMIAKKNVKVAKSIEDFRGMKVAVPKSFAVREFLQERYPGLFRIVEVEHVREGLRDVAFDVVDLLVANIATASYHTEKQAIPNLHVVGELEMRYAYCLAVSNNYPLLHSILSKAVDDISPEEIDRIHRRWLKAPLVTHHTVRFLRIGFYVGGALMLLFLVNSLWLKARLRRSIAELSRQQEQYRTLFEEAPVGIFTSSAAHCFQRANKKMAEILGYPSREALVETVRDIRREVFTDPQQFDAFHQDLEKEGRIINQAFEFIHPDDDRHWLNLTMRRAVNEKGEVNFEGFCQDITSERKSKEAEEQSKIQLEYELFHDSLTRLGNRRRCMKEIWELVRTSRQTNIFILFFDINRFKDFNHTYGYSQGDRLLTQIAARIRHVLGEDGGAHRVGGDQFAVVRKVASEEEAMRLAHAIRDAVCTPYAVGPEHLEMEFSFGMALCGHGEPDPEKILRRSVLAHNEAKKTASDQIVVYDDLLHEKHVRRLSINRCLRPGLLRGEFFLEYQPILDVRTDRLHGLEALLRWNSGEYGLLEPAEFIPLAEESEQIIPLGEFAIEKACRFWTAAGLTEQNLILAVNVSGKQFDQRGFVKRLQTLLYRTSMPSHQLKLEITETALMKNAKETAAKQEELAAMGVHISIDDFGTGYSSLDYLRRFAADTLKIDMSFVQKMETDSKSLELVKAMVNLAETFDMLVVAEGVETEKQKRLLESLGCHLHQGFLYSRPLQEQDLPQLLRRFSPSLSLSAP
ncbi:MAG: EAL domain-containing protein [Deltaproteobacteria bacterium]|nr:EAL domain-containing protein [Deltaproteobacteria bacterium]